MRSDAAGARRMEAIAVELAAQIRPREAGRRVQNPPPTGSGQRSGGSVGDSTSGAVGGGLPSRLTLPRKRGRELRNPGVRSRRLELPHPCGYQNLNLARLPVPPRPLVLETGNLLDQGARVIQFGPYSICTRWHPAPDIPARRGAQACESGVAQCGRRSTPRAGQIPVRAGCGGRWPPPRPWQ